MGKLNRKGFTLVELLAVIVILAIVVGITLVTVLPTIKEARQEAFDVTAETAAEYFTKQYELNIVGQTTNITTFPSTNATATSLNNENDYTQAGIKKGNYTSAKWYITSSGKACVVLVAAATGDYNNIEYTTACSAACSLTTHTECNRNKTN